MESENFTVRRMTVWKTLSPQAWTKRSITSRECRVRPSNIVPSTPSISSLGFNRSRTLSIVVLSRATPRSAKYSHSSGTITPSEAVRALTVSRPREGWQSMRMTSYSASAGWSTRCSVCSRATSCTSCTSAAERSMLEGSRSIPGTPEGTTTSSSATSRSISRL